MKSIFICPKCGGELQIVQGVAWCKNISCTWGKQKKENIDKKNKK